MLARRGGSHDLGVIAAKAFADPEGYIGRDLKLAAEFRSLEECRSTYARVVGRGPRRFPMPLWLFQRFTPDTVRMWEWCREHDLDTDPRARPVHSSRRHDGRDVAAFAQDGTGPGRRRRS